MIGNRQTYEAIIEDGNCNDVACEADGCFLNCIKVDGLSPDSWDEFTVDLAKKEIQKMDNEPLKMVGDQRHGNPKAEDFTGAWPRTFKVLAMKGIYDPLSESIFGKTWGIAICTHLGEEYRPFIDAGANEHGVEYSVKYWYRLEVE